MSDIVDRLRGLRVTRNPSRSVVACDETTIIEAADTIEKLRAALAKTHEPDWFWRDLDPDDSGDTIGEALRYMPDGCVCAISSSYKGPSFFAARVPVLDLESDDTEEICTKTEAECLSAVKERMAARAALKETKNAD